MGIAATHIRKAKDERGYPLETQEELVGRVPAQELNKASFEIISRGRT